MTKVHILSPEVIAKIAAGEVIERPASVVKELLENSLDAGAINIEIELKEAGKSIIRVKDDGSGIDKGDLKTIFERHATSKIEGLDDLYAIMSLGFRGEALYSIAAVAHVTVDSKTAQQDSGWSMHLRGGEEFHHRPCRFNDHGTEVTIKELFFNTPARKKFLKSNTAEVHQILNLTVPYTLMRHETRFTLTHGARSLLSVAPTADKIGRMADVLNIDRKSLLEVRQDDPEHDMSVHLVLGDINLKRARRDMQFIFVNGRPVQNKAVGYHMNQVYRLIMPPDLYPCFAVFINVPASDVDANVHPTKREVKIKDERDVCAMLRVLTEETLMRTGRTKQVVGPRAAGAGAQAVDHALSRSVPSEFTFDADAPAGRHEVPVDGGDYAYPRRQAAARTETQQSFFIPENTILTANEESLQAKLAGARYIGGFASKYLFFEAGASVLVVDQHAAAERITYEQLIHQMEKGTIEVQHLLSPVLMKLTPQEIVVWEDAKDKFEALGLSVTQWDDETLAIHTHPLFLKDIEQTMQNLLAGEDIGTCDHDTMARRACRSSVMAGDKLAAEQAVHVRDELCKCLDPFTCPHGRPTVIEIKREFLDKQFLRT